jgi:hypothetical protein
MGTGMILLKGILRVTGMARRLVWGISGVSWTEMVYCRLRDFFVCVGFVWSIVLVLMLVMVAMVQRSMSPELESRRYTCSDFLGRPGFLIPGLATSSIGPGVAVVDFLGRPLLTTDVDASGAALVDFLTVVFEAGGAIVVGGFRPVATHQHHQSSRTSLR